MVDVQSTALVAAKQQLQQQQSQVEAAEQNRLQAEQIRTQQIQQARRVGQSYGERLRIAQQAGSGLAGMRALQQQRVAVGKYEKQTGEQLREYSSQIESAKKTLEENKKSVSSYEEQVKQYEQALKEQQEYDDAVKRVERHAKKGMLWAIRAYGSPIEKQIAKEMLKRGVPASDLKLIEAGKARSEAIKEAKSLGAEVKGGTLFYNNKPLKLSDVPKLSLEKQQSFQQGSDLSIVNEVSKLPEGARIININKEGIGYVIPKNTSSSNNNDLSMSQRYALATQDLKIAGTINFIGTETQRGLENSGLSIFSKNINIPARNETITYGTMVINPKTGQFEPLKQYREAENVTLEYDPLARTIGIGASMVPYSIPFLGEGLLIAGGIEQGIKGDTKLEKGMGYGSAILGGVSLYNAFKGIKQISDIKSAKTTFYAEENNLGDFSKVQVITKTQVGKTPYFSFVKELIVDSPADDTLRLGASRGIIIKGNKELRKFDMLDNRLSPLKMGSISKTIDKGVTFTQKSSGALIKKEMQSGVISGAYVKRLDGTYEKIFTMGAYKPMQENYFSFVGGSKISKITDDTQKYKSSTEIRGVIKQKPLDKLGLYDTLIFEIVEQPTAKANFLEKIKSNRLVKSKKSQALLQLSKEQNPFFNIPEPKFNSKLSQTPQVLSKDTIAQTLQQVQQQRTAVLELAKESIVKPSTLLNIRTGGAAMLLSTNDSKLKDETKTLQTNSITNQIETKQDTIPRVSTTQSLTSIETQQTKVIPKTSLLLKVNQITTPRLDSFSWTATRSKEQTRTKPQQNVSVRQNTILKTRIPPIALPEGSKKISRVLQKIKKKKLFDIFIRRRKRDIRVGKAQTKEGASRILKNYLKGSLAASGYVSSEGKKLSAETIGMDYEFGKSKKEAFRLIQKRGFRLGTRSEIGEILSTKRKKRLGWF